MISGNYCCVGGIYYGLTASSVLVKAQESWIEKEFSEPAILILYFANNLSDIQYHGHENTNKPSGALLEKKYPFVRDINYKLTRLTAGSFESASYSMNNGKFVDKSVSFKVSDLYNVSLSFLSRREKGDEIPYLIKVKTAPEKIDDE